MHFFSEQWRSECHSLSDMSFATNVFVRAFSDETVMYFESFVHRYFCTCLWVLCYGESNLNSYHFKVLENEEKFNAFPVGFVFLREHYHILYIIITIYVYKHLFEIQE